MCTGQWDWRPYSSSLRLCPSNRMKCAWEHKQPAKWMEEIFQKNKTLKWNNMFIKRKTQKKNSDEVTKNTINYTKHWAECRLVRRPYATVRAWISLQKRKNVFHSFNYLVSEIGGFAWSSSGRCCNRRRSYFGETISLIHVVCCTRCECQAGRYSVNSINIQSEMFLVFRFHCIVQQQQQQQQSQQLQRRPLQLRSVALNNRHQSKQNIFEMLVLFNLDALSKPFGIKWISLLLSRYLK